MITLNSWMQLGLGFLIPLTITSAGGVVYYLLGRELDRQVAARYPDLLPNLGLILVVVGGCLVFAVLPPKAFVIGAGFLFAICTAGTFAERVAHPSTQKWSVVMWRMVLTTVCSTLFSPLWYLVVGSLLQLVSTTTFFSQWSMAGLLFGAICSPSAIPFFLWIWKTLPLRPGIDTHLERREEAPSEQHL